MTTADGATISEAARSVPEISDRSYVVLRNLIKTDLTPIVLENIRNKPSFVAYQECLVNRTIIGSDKNLLSRILVSIMPVPCDRIDQHVLEDKESDVLKRNIKQVTKRRNHKHVNVIIDM